MTLLYLLLFGLLQTLPRGDVRLFRQLGLLICLQHRLFHSLEFNPRCFLCYLGGHQNNQKKTKITIKIKKKDGERETMEMKTKMKTHNTVSNSTLVPLQLLLLVLSMCMIPLPAPV